MGYYNTDYLAHHGVLGQKWGVRRYQNKDGSLTEAGKAKAAKGAQGRAEILREGEAKARNKRIKGAIVAPVAGIGTGVGTAAAGTAIGSTVGPAGTIAGLATGSIAGYGVGKATSAITKALFNEKANAINSEYKILANEIMNKYANTKVKDIEYNIKRDNAERAKNFDKYVDENGGKLTVANFPSHDREGYPTYMLSDKQKQKYADDYNKKRNSFKTDEEKDLRQAQKEEAKWNDSKSYNKGFLDYLKREGSKPEDFDDHEYLELIKMEYETDTGKKAMKRL